MKERTRKTKVNENKGEGKQKQQRRTNLKSWGFILPSLLGVLVFFVIPFIVVIYYAMINNPVQKEFVFLDNIIRVFGNGAFRRAAGNTLKFSFTAVPLAVILSLALAALLERKMPWKSQFRTFFLTPMMVPVASIVLIFQVMFHYNGAFNDLLGMFGVDKIDWLKSDHAMFVITILFLWKKICHPVALSSLATSMRSFGILASAAIKMIILYPRFFHKKRIVITNIA